MGLAVFDLRIVLDSNSIYIEMFNCYSRTCLGVILAKDVWPIECWDVALYHLFISEFDCIVIMHTCTKKVY